MSDAALVNPLSFSNPYKSPPALDFSSMADFNNMSVDNMFPYGLLTTSGMIFETGSPLNFMRFMSMDDGVTESLSANYNKISMLGRSLPVFAFTGMQGRSVTITLHFHAHALPLLEVHRKIQWLKKLQFMRDMPDMSIPPPKVTLLLGAYIMMNGVVTNVSATHNAPFGGLNTPAGFISMLPHYATCDITVEETENFYTGDLPDYDTADAEASLMVSMLGIPSFLMSPLNLL